MGVDEAWNSRLKVSREGMNGLAFFRAVLLVSGVGAGALHWPGLVLAAWHTCTGINVALGDTACRLECQGPQRGIALARQHHPGQAGMHAGMLKSKGHFDGKLPRQGTYARQCQSSAQLSPSLQVPRED